MLTFNVYPVNLILRVSQLAAWIEVSLSFFSFPVFMYKYLFFFLQQILKKWNTKCQEFFSTSSKCLIPPQGFRPEDEIPRRHSKTSNPSVYYKESTYRWNIQSVCQKKSRFAWIGAARNRKVMMTFLLFGPPSTKWLGSNERKSRRDR